jgi:hypothetical protein
MKLTDEQIWKCNISDDGSAHICMAYQNVIPFARAVEREIGFTKAELWIKRIDDAVKAEREACAKLCEQQYEYYGFDHVFAAKIRARSNHG